VVVAPSVILWTFAGLETPLLATIVSAIAVAYTRVTLDRRRSLAALATLAGVAVLTRFDSVLFAGPVLGAALLQRNRSWRERITVVTIAGALPALWLLYSWLQFGAVLPTSFYIKTPSAAVDDITINLWYMAEHLVITGAGAMAVYTAFQLIAAGTPGVTIAHEFRRSWGLHVGLLAVLAYGASMATVHMMFAFRHFVPYLGATALALAQIARRSDERMEDRLRPRIAYAAALAALLILVVHAFQAEALYRRSLQGLGTFGEYGQQGAAGYARDYIPAMQRNAADIRAHWSLRNKDRTPRIWTFAAGALPYAYREAYIFEPLVSFRHRCPPNEGNSRPDARIWRAHADYIHAFTRHGSLSRLLSPVRARQVELISEQPLHFNGRDEALLVYYNPAPRGNVVPPGVDDPCTNTTAEHP
jgi:hypothetical protein